MAEAAGRPGKIVVEMAVEIVAFAAVVQYGSRIVKKNAWSDVDAMNEASMSGPEGMPPEVALWRRRWRSSWKEVWKGVNSTARGESAEASTVSAEASASFMGAR